MGFPLMPTSLCCCISPRTGTLIVAYLGLLFCSVSIVLIMAMVGSGNHLTLCNLKFNETAAEVEEEMNLGHPHRNFTVHNVKVFKDFCQKGALSVVVVCSMLNFLYIALCVALIFGVNKQTPGLLLPFLVMFPWLFLIPSLVGYFYGLVSFGRNAQWVGFLILLFLGIFGLVVMFHLYLIVLVYRLQISGARVSPCGSEPKSE